MLVALFVVGLVGLGVGLFTRDAAFFATGTILEAAIAWPIREVNKLRRQAILIDTVLALLPLLQGPEAQAQLIALIDLVLEEGRR
jgi:hypothetical protein